jgi:RNA polymerase sigma-70 factor (ECF subfamily)
MLKDEAKIINDCQNGKLDGFGLLYDAYFRKIYNFVYYKTLHRETAEDLVSLTFTKALKNIDQYQSKAGTFSAWLYQIARNNVTDHYRKLKDEANLDDIYDLAADDDPQLDAGNRLLFEQAQEQLKKLKPEQREIIMLRLWEGLSYREIAGLTGKSEANCKVSFARAIGKLREGLAPVLLLIYALKLHI